MDFRNKLELFVPGKPFQPSLVLAGNAGTNMSEAPFRCSTLGRLLASHYTRLERLDRDKHSSLLQKSINYHRKKFTEQARDVLMEKLGQFLHH